MNISETTRDRAIVAIERQYEVICVNGVATGGLGGPGPQSLENKW